MINKIDITAVEIPLSETFTISIGPRTSVHNIFIRIFNEKNIFGTGECGLVRTIISESQKEQIEAAKTIGAKLLGQSEHEIQSIHQIMDDVHAKFSSVKAAMDIALHDLAAKQCGLPLYRYLGGTNHKKIYTDRTVSLSTPEKMAADAKAYVDAGFLSLKLKLGKAQNDLERVHQIRHAVGVNIPISIDANQGWTVDEAMDMLQKLDKYNIHHCEAPVLASDIEGLKKVRAASHIEIMGDESVFDHQDAYRLLKDQSIDSVNIKLGKSGGIYKATKIAGVCDAARIDAQVGCFSETRLGLSALAHFSLAHPCITMHDMDSSLMHSEDPIHGGIIFESNFRIHLDESPGHGASVDEAFLSRFLTITIS